MCTTRALKSDTPPLWRGTLCTLWCRSRSRIDL